MIAWDWRRATVSSSIGAVVVVLSILYKYHVCRNEALMVEIFYEVLNYESLVETDAYPVRKIQCLDM